MGKEKKRKRSSSSASSEEDHRSTRKLLKRLKKLEKRMSRDYRRSRSRSSMALSRSQSPQDLRSVTPSGSHHNSPERRPQDNVRESASPSPALIVHNDEELPQDFLQILGENPNDVKEKVVIPSELLTRWSYILYNGLPSSDKQPLIEEYQLESENGVSPPTLNSEVAAIIAASCVKKDAYQMATQSQLLSSLAAHSQGLKLLFKTKALDQALKTELGKIFSDSAKLIADAFYTMSLTRRHLLYPSLTKKAKEISLKVPPKEFLFGKDIGEEIKKAKSLEKLGKEIKAASTSTYNSLEQKREGGAQQQASRYKTTRSSYVPLNRKGPTRPTRETRSSIGQPSKVQTQRTRGY
ncbi:uncharacterized protein LOC123008958 isoform X2 [Tribolium madens]|nr:uncharacterized protein LOC123008958 isoform X2 [Tribolium madens]